MGGRISRLMSKYRSVVLKIGQLSDIASPRIRSQCQRGQHAKTAEPHTIHCSIPASSYIILTLLSSFFFPSFPITLVWDNTQSHELLSSTRTTSAIKPQRPWKLTSYSRCLCRTKPPLKNRRSTH